VRASAFRKVPAVPDPNPAAVDFLRTRRSRPAKTLGLPVPDADSLRALLTIAARSPDHGKLEPWRFIVIERAAMLRLASLVAERGAALGLAQDRIDKGASQFANGNLAVAVICAPKPHPTIPDIEQHLSAGAVCLALLNAALASGWGANWLSGWPSHDAEFCARGFGLVPGEFVAGLVHIGTETATPPERPRPDIDALTTWARA
jgi:nitroreductase